MPKYLFKATYTTEGVKGVVQAGGSSRRAAVEEMAASVGGSVEAFYFAFGESDVYVIVDLPDNEAATAISLTANAAGLAQVQTVPLLTTEEVDSAAQKSVPYRPPGE